METQRLSTIACEVCKTLNDLNPNFLKEISDRSSNVTHRKDNFYVHSRNAIKVGSKIRSVGAHIQN